MTGFSLRLDPVKISRSRGESKQILQTLLDAFLFGVSLNSVAAMHVQLIPMILLRLTIQRNFTWETFKCQHECKGGNLWSVIPNFLISKWRILKIGLFPLRNLLLYKRKRSQGKLTAESWSHPWTCLGKFPGGIHCVSCVFLTRLFEAAVSALEKRSVVSIRKGYDLVLLSFNRPILKLPA